MSQTNSNRIACLYIPDFPIAVLEREGVIAKDLPVALIDGEGSHTRVILINEWSRKKGVTLGVHP